MNKLKLLKPWRLPTVRLSLNAQASPVGTPVPVSIMPCADLIALADRNMMNEGRTAALQTCGSPSEPTSKRRAPVRRAIFASTASPHPGCPHLFS